MDFAEVGLDLEVDNGDDDFAVGVVEDGEGAGFVGAVGWWAGG